MLTSTGAKDGGGSSTGPLPAVSANRRALGAGLVAKLMNVGVPPQHCGWTAVGHPLVSMRNRKHLVDVVGGASASGPFDSTQ